MIIRATWMKSREISLWFLFTVIKKATEINAGEVVEKKEPPCTVGGNANWYSHCKKQYGVSSKN